jgi:hypothetical protein
MVETWKAVQGWPNYEVSDHGRVRSWNRRSRRASEPRVMKPRLDGKGYARITLCHEGQQRERFIHQIVLEAFVGERPTPAHEGRHLDGVRSNNSAANLAWSTHAENMRDQYVHGTRACRERHGSARLTAAQVAEIRAHPGPLPAIAEAYGISKSHACHLRKGRGWAA